MPTDEAINEAVADMLAEDPVLNKMNEDLKIKWLGECLLGEVPSQEQMLEKLNHLEMLITLAEIRLGIDEL